MDNNKQKIIDLFRTNIKGKKPNIDNYNQKHDGKEGHWLEQQFGILANANNEADFLGYELKNQTTSGKTTFGDWSANEYIYKNQKYSHLFPKKQDSFCQIFGKFNEKKQRYSWSGEPIPKYNQYSSYGQILIIENNLDVTIYYSFSKDQRKDKFQIIPKELQCDNIEIAKWYGYPHENMGKSKALKQKLEDKFNQNGWFTCKKNNDGIYDKICFGEPISFENWIELIRTGTVFFDSGMYEGNKRPYS